MLTVGSLIKWENYPFQKDEEIKDRYFLYVGTSSRYSCPFLFYLGYTTTKLKYYEKDGGRENHSFIKVIPGQYNLPLESIIDFDMLRHEVSLQQNDITEIYRFTNEELRCIVWPAIKKSRNIAKIIKKDIKNCFENIGVTNLHI